MTSAYAPSILRNALCHASKTNNKNNKAKHPMKYLYTKAIRAAAVLLFAVMAFLPMAAIGQVTVSNFDNLKYYLERGYSVTLGSDIVLTDRITINSNTAPTIYGQGYTLSRNSSAKGFIKIAGTNARLTVSNVVFDGKGYRSSYAMIHCGVDLDSYNNERLTVNNCTFKRCDKLGQTEGSSGSAINCHGSNVVLTCTDVEFSGNINRDTHADLTSTVHGGGALAVISGVTFYLTRCNFYDNVAAESGGAIYLFGAGEGSIKDCNIGIDASDNARPNIAYIVGGGIFGTINPGKTLRIQGETRIQYNRVDFDSNNTYLSSANRTKFGQGGGIYFISGASGTTSSVIIGDDDNTSGGPETITISNNYARGGGGGMVLWCNKENSYFRLQNFILDSNESGEVNSGISGSEGYYVNGSPRALLGGGGIFIFGNTDLDHNYTHLIIKNGTISNNWSKNRGGGMYVNGHDCKVENVTFTNNYTTATDSRGGALWLRGGTAYYSGSTLHENLIMNCTFKKNGIQSGTTKTGYGGAIYAYDKTEVSILGSTIGGSTTDANKATNDGGGIYIGANTYLIIDKQGTTPTKVSYNVAGENGGGIYVASGSQGHTNIGSNSSGYPVEICYNTASMYGGGIYLDCGGHADDKFTLKYFKLNNNTSLHGGGAYLHGGHVSGVNHGAMTISDGASRLSSG